MIASAAAAEDDGSESLSIEDLPVEKKDDSELARIRTALGSNFLFAPLTDDQKDKCYAAMRRVETSKGQVVYSSGDPSDCFYLCDSGEYDSTVVLGGGKQETSHIHEGTHHHQQHSNIAALPPTHSHHPPSLLLLHAQVHLVSWALCTRSRGRLLCGASRRVCCGRWIGRSSAQS